LFGNAAFAETAGSELVILEIAEDLIRRGWACDLVTWAPGPPMAEVARKAGVGVLNQPTKVRPLAYDLVWLQNRIEPVLDYSDAPDDAPRTLFAFAHLDRNWFFAQPGVIAERQLGQMFVVPSELGRQRIVEAGLDHTKVHMFRNAAPAGFEMQPPPARERPERLLVVSNHAPAEVMQAIPLLRAAGVETIHWGHGGDVRDKRLMPADIAGADAVITIGKTVPYVLRARRPAYVYDHFGGPGWLRSENFVGARERNFSGLCCERRLDAAAIAAEVLDGYAAAAAEAAARSEAELAPFRLEPFIDSVLAAAASAPTPAEHRARLAPLALALKAERHLAEAAGSYFGAFMSLWRKQQAEDASA
jgi:hypothetical protein